MRTPSDSYDRSKKNALIGSFPWASDISDAPFTSLLLITILNEIIKGSETR